MKTLLGTEVDLGPGHVVLDGVPALRERDIAAPSFLGPFANTLTYLKFSIKITSYNYEFISLYLVQSGSVL